MRNSIDAIYRFSRIIAFFFLFFPRTQQPKIVFSPVGLEETLETREFPLLTRFRKILYRKQVSRLFSKFRTKETSNNESVPYRSPT